MGEEKMRGNVDQIFHSGGCDAHRRDRQYWILVRHHAHWLRTESGWDQTGPLFLSGGILFTCLGPFFAALNYRRLQRPR